MPLLIGLMVLGAVGGLFYFAHTATAPSSPAKPQLPGPPYTSYQGSQGMPSSVVSPTSGITWVAAGNVTNLDAGNLYRWSLARRSTRTQPQILTALAPNFDQAQAWIDSYPPDWAPDDRGPGRNRLQGVPKAGEVLNGPDGTPDPTVLVWQGFPASGSSVAAAPQGNVTVGPIITVPPGSSTPGSGTLV
jgi:hypothetical protein